METFQASTSPSTADAHPNILLWARSLAICTRNLSFPILRRFRHGQQHSLGKYSCMWAETAAAARCTPPVKKRQQHVYKRFSGWHRPVPSPW